MDFELARRRILEYAARLDVERAAIDEAWGRVLAEDVIAELDLPPFDYSAMDGYAVRCADLEEPKPYRLPVSIELCAGDVRRVLPPQSAARIFTGAPLPLGADAVVMQEQTTRDGDFVELSGLPRPGDHVRRSGEDMKRGVTALSNGMRLNPFRIGLAAALDRATLQVAAAPRVSFISTGAELRAPGAPARPGSIPDSNTPSLAAMARSAGASIVSRARVGDDLHETRAAVRQALERSHVLVSVGGVSVGEHDVVKDALEAEGVRLEFWKVKIRPGKPFVFGRRGSVLVLGLPGNPVSSQITFALFGLPLLRALQGERDPLPPLWRVKLAHAFHQKPGRLGFYRARLRGDLAELDANQASGAPTSMASADALVLVPAECEELPAGAELDAYRLAEL